MFANLRKLKANAFEAFKRRDDLSEVVLEDLHLCILFLQGTSTHFIKDHLVCPYLTHHSVQNLPHRSIRYNRSIPSQESFCSGNELNVVKVK